MKKDKLSSKDTYTNTTVHGISPLYYFGKSIWSLARFLIMISLAFVILYPVIFMVSMAFRTVDDVYNPTIVWIPKHFTLENFVKVNTVVNYFKALLNTVFLSFGSSILQIFICAFAGYGIARFNFKFKSFVIAGVLITIVVPSQMISLPNYFLFKNFDIFGIIHLLTGKQSGLSLLDTPFSFFIMAALGVGIRSGLFVLIFMQFFRNMPKDLENAALVDGCGFAGTYFKIILPNALNIILIGFLFSFVWYWNDFYLSNAYMPTYVTISTALANLQASLELLVGNGGKAWDPYEIATIQQAFCLLSITPLIILYCFTQRYFTESIERTGIVG